MLSPRQLQSHKVRDRLISDHLELPQFYPFFCLLCKLLFVSFPQLPQETPEFGHYKLNPGGQKAVLFPGKETEAQQG